MWKMIVKSWCCVLDGLVQQQNSLIAEIQSLKEEHELAVSALNVTHEVEVQSLHERFECELTAQLEAG